MKDNRIDELFRSGLESSKITPPHNAWAKIEEGLPKKNKKGAYFWLSIAATIMLFATIGWLAFSNRQTVQIATQEVLTEVKTEIDQNKASTTDDLNIKAETSSKEDRSREDEKLEEKIIEVINPVQSPNTPLLTSNTPSSDTKDLQESLIERSESLIKESTSVQINFLEPKAFQRLSFTASITGIQSISVSSDILMKNMMLSPDEFEQLEDEKRKRSGFISGIVSVAKSVNSGTKALSEIRKSKNEFITNDLKYGQKTDGSAEGIDEPPTKQ